MEPNAIIRERRAALRLTLEDIARAVGVSAATVSRWESGEIKNFRSDKIVRLASALQVNPSDLMGCKENGDNKKSHEVGLGKAKTSRRSREYAQLQRDIEIARKRLEEQKRQNKLVTETLSQIGEAACFDGIISANPTRRDLEGLVRHVENTLSSASPEEQAALRDALRRVLAQDKGE